MRLVDVAAFPDESIDVIYRHIDTLLAAGLTSAVDAILVDTSKHLDNMCTVEALAYASITFLASAALPSRPAFMTKLREQLTVIEPERVDELLRGLEC